MGQAEAAQFDGGYTEGYGDGLQEQHDMTQLARELMEQLEDYWIDSAWNVTADERPRYQKTAALLDRAERILR